MIRVQECTLFFCNGGESEAWVEDLLADQPVETLRMLDCVDALEEEEKEGMQEIFEEEHEDEEGPEYDEHVWTSPVNAVLICEALCERLCALDPEGEAYYRANLERYTRSWRRWTPPFAELWTGEICAPWCLPTASRCAISWRNTAWTTSRPSPAARRIRSPRPARWPFSSTGCGRSRLPAVFYIEFSNEKMADVICEDTGCRKLLFHSCHNVSAEDLENGVTYLQLMWGNVNALKEALG